MAKEKSSEIVSDEAEMERRFKQLEDDSAATKSLVEKMAEKLLGKPEPTPKLKEKPGNANPLPTSSPAKKFFQDIGLLVKDTEV
jgi:hypothetical protein